MITQNRYEILRNQQHRGAKQRVEAYIHCTVRKQKGGKVMLLLADLFVRFSRFWSMILLHEVLYDV